MITVDDYLALVGVTLDGYRRVLGRLDDASMNRAPDAEGANAPFAIVAHATGAARFWALHVVLAEPTTHDRAAEFTSTGTVEDLRRLVDELQRDLTTAGPRLAQAGDLEGDPGWTPDGWEWTVGSVLLHAYEELAQHLGHLELSADLVSGS